ncbi:enoyl-CoA hydratase-related protein [Mycobacterium sp.]|uniref:enoyl-CoA hydratase/isomerase family protein n=1 Tax=Mycobacterium sp. TaxID=1785 RepID=UPI0012279B15|nr:enoyl-CoA hydratase-related protein [Mycobacterium sp.]TAM69711.1 MAG: enoyl-CoA hydratase/isomerase family protein [Mycobacterium sp.]
MGLIEVDEPRENILLLRLNRPEALNAMNAELIEALHGVLHDIRDDSRIRAVVLTGAGRVFCAGLDLRGYGTVPGSPQDGEGRAQAGLRVQKHIADLADTLRRVRAPIIAAVNGAAAGGGMALALLCDIRVAGASAVFHPSFIKRGLSNCDIGVSWLLPRMIGFSRAADLLLTGASLDAPEAERIGVVSAVVPDDTLLDAALDRASAIAAHSPFGVWMTKDVLWANMETPSLRGGVELENRTQILAASTKDHAEAVTAFLEKRPAVYRNR